MTAICLEMTQVCRHAFDRQANGDALQALAACVHDLLHQACMHVSPDQAVVTLMRRLHASLLCRQPNDCIVASVT